jgi:hypothetical protein
LFDQLGDRQRDLEIESHPLASGHPRQVPTCEVTSRC